MKKIFTLFLTTVISKQCFSQLQSQGTVPANNTNNRADAAWYRGGNTPIGTTPTNANIFGTRWNSPIYTITNNSNRSKLNGQFGIIGAIQYPINGFSAFQGVNTSGYFFLGTDFGTGATSFYNTKGAFSLFHLNGNENNAGAPQEFGYRPWMKTGITFTDNNDRSYLGLRSTNGLDITDFVINWSDNSIGGVPSGPDNLIFNFTSGDGNPGSPSEFYGGDTPEGREIARMTGYGNMGIGPRFNNTQNPVANAMGQPQSQLHVANFENWATWLQFGNELIGGALSDGLRMGIVGSIQNATNPLFLLNNFAAFPDAVGIGMIYNQENKPLLFSTGKSTNSFIGSNSTGERVRIQAAGTITQVNSGAYSVFNPGNINPDFTRVSISHDPTVPITKPLSLLHMGYNTLPALDGWRSWMDVGTFIGYNSDNMYIGMKDEGNNRKDAVINFGNDINTGITQVDHLRFIFTQTSGLATTGGTTNGVEIARMVSDGTYGFTGFGNFDLLAIEPQNTIHINSSAANATSSAGGTSGLRFQDLNTGTTPITNPGTGILAVDANGDVIYVKGSSNFGNYCNDPNPTTLLGDYQINMANNSIYFENGKRIMMGEVGCSNVAPARLYLRYSNPQYYPTITEGMRIETNLPQQNITARFINTLGNGFAIRADGNIFCNGTGFATGTWTPSDSVFKTSIQTITNASAILGAINPVSYFYDTLNSGLNFSPNKQFGFIAQQVENVLPELVENFTIPAEHDSTGIISNPDRTFKVMNYNALFAILTQGHQEQQTTIDSLIQVTSQQDSINKKMQDQINTLYNMITECCKGKSMEKQGYTGQWENAQKVELRDDQSIILDQNVPNPFAEQTTITYFLPETVQRAQVLFYNAEGKLINSVELQQKGNGQINVFANDLSNGIYTYTLIADGQIIATKRMIKQK